MEEEFRDKIYNKTFNDVYDDMQRRRVCDPRFTKKELEAILQGLYINHGHDWLGRGELNDLTNEATIAACELLLSEWQAEQE